MTSVKLCFLGTPSVEVDGVVTTHFRWSRLPALFAYLVLFPGDQTRESIADALWPDRAPEKARQNLRQTLVYADQLFAPNTSQVLKITRQTIGLKKSAISSDIEAFVRHPSPILDRSGRARCLHLVEHYPGPFLPNVEDEWIANARIQIARTYQESLVFLSKDLLPADPNRSLSLAETAVAEDPFDDPARAAKIEALRALGRDAAAQQEFTAYASFLNEELGMQPGRIVIEALREKLPGPVQAETPPEPVDPGTEAITEAVQFLRGQGLYKEAADLALALVPVWIGKGTPSFGQKFLTDAFQEMKRPVGVFEKLSLAKLSHAEGDMVKTRELCEEILKSSQPPEAIAETVLLMARLDLREMKPVSALRYALSSLRLLRKLGSRDLEYQAWNCVVISRVSSGQFGRVIQPTRRAEKLSEYMPESTSRQEVRLFRAFALLRLERLEEAQLIAEEIWSESRLAGPFPRQRPRGTLGRLLEDLGKPEQAKILYNEAIAEYESRGDAFALNVTITYLGDLELEMGNADESLRNHFLALKSRRELKQNLGIATNLRGIGRALLRKGYANEARLSLQESTQRFRDDNALSGYASSQLLLAQAEFEAGDPLLARRLAQNSVEILRGMSLPGRLTIGPWGDHILEEGEDLLRRIEGRNSPGNIAEGGC